jgi:hypothetical protein
MNPKVAVVYTDQGPGGICGQDVNTTSCWTKVWLFESFDEAVKFTQKYPVAGSRKRARYTICTTQDYEHYSYINSLEIP